MTYRLTDGLGSTVNLCDGSGNVLVTYAYDAFGAIRSQTGSSGNYWKFTGEQRDGESGFDYLRARYYDPEVGRFLSVDPWGEGFGYAGNNPVNFVDPFGLSAVCTDWREGLCYGTTELPDEFDKHFYVAEDIPVDESPSYWMLRIVYSGASGEVLQELEYSSNPGWHESKNRDQRLGPGGPGGGTPPKLPSGPLADLRLKLHSMEGATPQQVRDLIPRTWRSAPSTSGGGVKFFDGKGNQVRIMPGTPGIGNVHGGPYMVVSIYGTIAWVPLAGNPMLP
jgi:RHS repeat-associated protein